MTCCQKDRGVICRVALCRHLLGWLTVCVSLVSNIAGPHNSSPMVIPSFVPSFVQVTHSAARVVISTR